MSAIRTVLFVLLMLVTGPIYASDGITFFRIGTGEPSSTYFPLGGVIANALSQPPGARSCARGGACGVEGMVAVASATAGSVDNVSRIAEGRLEAGFAQADIAFFAQTGTGQFEQRGAVEDLRVIASLYPEHLHVVVPTALDISDVADLAGKRVSLGELGSGTYANAHTILDAFGLGMTGVRPYTLKSGPASDRLREGRLDAYFLVAGAPAPSVHELLASEAGKLLSITGSPANRIAEENPFFYRSDLPEGAYGQYNRALTLAVSALLVTRADMDEDLIYDVTKALFHPRNQRLYSGAHYMGRWITPESAQEGAVIPFHSGALRYYREAGVTQ